jgi:hypothetical protein
VEIGCLRGAQMITVETLNADTAAMLAAIAEVRPRPPEMRADASGRPLTVHFEPNWAPGIVRRKLSGARFAGVVERFLADPGANASLLDAFINQCRAVGAAIERAAAQGGKP